MNRIFRLARRNAVATTPLSTLIITLLMPVLALFTVGTSLSGLIPPFIVSGREIPYPAFLAAGVVALAAVQSALFSGSSLWIDRRSGMLEQILVGPFNRADYILSKIISSVSLGIVSATIILILAAPVLSSTPITASGFLIGLGAILLELFLFGAFAMIVASLVKSETTFYSVQNLLIVVLIFISSIFYPAENAPQIVQALLLINPVTYVVDIVRFGFFELTTPLLIFEVGALISEVFLIFLAAVYVFKRAKLA